MEENCTQKEIGLDAWSYQNVTSGKISKKKKPGALENVIKKGRSAQQKHHL